MVHLNTLGRLDLRGNSGEPLAAVTSRPREMALLIYLATGGPGAYRRRDTVLAMFWPETPEDRARHTLNQMLYELRRTLGDGVLISRGQDEIGVSPELLECDVAEYRRALEEARWEDALALYRGPFLPGFFVSRAPDMERWIDDERQNHRRAARDAAVALSDQLEKEGDLPSAAKWAKRALEIEPASDSLLRRPLKLLHRLEERSEALVLFEDFRQRIAQDYGLEPSAETLELVATIRAAGAGQGGAPGQTETGSRRPVTAVTAGAGVARPGGDLSLQTAPSSGRGLGGTLAGAGAALVGAAAVSWVILSSGNPTTPPSLESTAPVVVVLPVAVSGSVSPDYGDLARALTGELTSRLGENPGLVVVATESVEPHLQEDVGAVQVGRELQGDAVVESGLDWQSTGVEASAQVTDVVSGEVIWGASRRYPHSELLNAQQFLTVGIASALNVRLGPIAQHDLTFSSGAELEAWSLISQAREAFNGSAPITPETEERARILIDRALALAPDYAPTHALQGIRYLAYWRSHRAEAQWLDSAIVSAERAMALDPGHYMSQISLAKAMNHAAVDAPERYPPALVRRGAEAALRAVQLNPSSFEASFLLGNLIGGAGRAFLWRERGYFLRRDWDRLYNNRAHKFWLLGNYDAASEARQLYIEMDPRQPSPLSYRIPEYNLSRGRFEESRRQIDSVRARDPDRVSVFPVAIYLALMEQRYEAAEELIEELLSREPPIEVLATSNFFTRTALGYVYLKTGRSREGTRLLEVVRDTELAAVQGGAGYSRHYNLARIYAMLGDADQANHWLGVAIDRGWPFYYTEMGRTDPMLESLLGNEEFERLMADLKEELDAERAWIEEMLALPEPERLHAMLIDAEERLEALWEAQGGDYASAGPSAKEHWSSPGARRMLG